MTFCDVRVFPLPHSLLSTPVASLRLSFISSTLCLHRCCLPPFPFIPLLCFHPCCLPPSILYSIPFVSLPALPLSSLYLILRSSSFSLLPVSSSTFSHILFSTSSSLSHLSSSPPMQFPQALSSSYIPFLQAFPSVHLSLISSVLLTKRLLLYLLPSSLFHRLIPPFLFPFLLLPSCFPSLPFPSPRSSFSYLPYHSLPLTPFRTFSLSPYLHPPCYHLPLPSLFLFPPLLRPSLPLPPSFPLRPYRHYLAHPSLYGCK